MTNRHVLLVTFLAAVSMMVFAHHGWEWATDEEFEISGIVMEATLGEPHGEVIIDVDGEPWLIEVGQPWRNARAGLSDDMFAAGTEISFHGHRSANPDWTVVKAEVVTIDGVEYDLYPSRDS